MWQECIIALHWLRFLPQASPSFNLQVDGWPTPQTSETPKRLVQLNAWQDLCENGWRYVGFFWFPWKWLPKMKPKILGPFWMMVNYKLDFNYYIYLLYVFKRIVVPETYKMVAILTSRVPWFADSFWLKIYSRATFGKQNRWIWDPSCCLMFQNVWSG